MKYKLTAEVARKAGIHRGMPGYRFASDGSCSFVAPDPDPPKPPQPKGPSGLAAALAARMVFTGQAVDLEEGVRLAGERFGVY